MTDKDLREIRRRFRPDKNNITYIRGCIVNSTKNIVANFSQPLATVSTEESEKLLAVMKKTFRALSAQTCLRLTLAQSKSKAAKNTDFSPLYVLRVLKTRKLSTNFTQRLSTA